MNQNIQPGCYYCGSTLTSIGIDSMNMEWPDGMSESDAICCEVDAGAI